MKKNTAYLTKSVLLKETGTPIIYRMVTYFTVAIFAVFLFWTIVTKLDEVASAKGEIIPTARVKKIQHQAGGKITNIYFSEGDQVKKGELMITLDPVHAKSQLAQKLSSHNALLLKKERLEAIIEGREPRFQSIPVDDASLLARQQNLYQHQVQGRASEKIMLQLQIDQAKSELKELDIRHQKLLRKKGFMMEEINIREGLVREGLNSKMLFLALQRQRSDLQGDIDVIPASKERLGKKIQELGHRDQEQEAKHLKGLYSELASISDQVIQSEEVLVRSKKDYVETNIYAPISGIINHIEPQNGGVLSPGSVIVEIVPEEKHYLAEVEISSKDIGHIREGLPVMVKFTTYDFMRYGGMKGVLDSVSSGALVNDTGKPYYKGLVSLEKNSFGKGKVGDPIMPGMEVTADIKTGSKSIMEYMLKPIFLSLKQAMRER